ncbi:SpoIID/LytB domain-containing protein [Cellulosimicrobium cellulans]
MVVGRLTRALVVLVASIALLLPLSGPAAADETAVPDAGGNFELWGHGYGHGRGLSQWGARGAASLGQSSAQILGFYYPGTILTGQPDEPIVVRLSTGRSGEVVVDGEPGLVLRWGGGDLPLPTVSPRGSAVLSWRLVRQGSSDLVLDYVDASRATWERYSLVPGVWGTFYAADGAVRLVRPSYDRREYRGGVGATVDKGALVTVNIVPLESYLLSVVPAEMPSSWPAAALGAQAVAARTYASHQRQNAGGQIDTCDTTACQVYSGRASYTMNGTLTTTHEAAATTAAIAATSGNVLITGGPRSYAFTQFSAANGGWTAAGSFPYLSARPDPYDGVVPSTANAWTAVVSSASVRSAYPTVGTPTRLTVLGRSGNGRWGGRVTQVRVEGTAGSVTVTGDTFRSAFGLRSTWWAVAGGTQGSGGVVADVTGDGVPDAYGRDATSGTLSFYPGRADGTFSPPRVVGSGWGMHDWIGSPGDVDKDGVPDLYARERSTGTLWLYGQARDGRSTSRRAVGTGWHTVDMIVAAGDVTGDGRPDLYARTTMLGDLLLYAGRADGTFDPPRTVNSGWHALDAVVSVGDVTGDGRPDLLGRLRSNGSLVLYRTGPGGTILDAKVVNSGWGGFDLLAGSAGSGGSALLAREPRTSGGLLRRYPVGPGGTILPAGLVGSGWDLHSAIS